MSNRLTIEVYPLESRIDGETLVLVLAWDDFNNQYTRHDVYSFLDYYPSEEALVQEVMGWDVFDGFEDVSKVDVIGFTETVDQVKKVAV